MNIDSRFDFARSPIEIPVRFRDVVYNWHHFPGAPDTDGLRGGANCQQYAYEFLRAHGYVVPDLRSSDLWEDVLYTTKIDAPEPFSLVLLHSGPQAWGAHVGVGLGNDLVLHLSKRIGVPAIERLDGMMQRPEYAFLIGAKRILVRSSVEPRQ